MEDVRKVKTIINRLNRVCDKEGLSIFDVLLSWQTELFDFLGLLGLDSSLLDDDVKETISNVAKNIDTRITYDPAMNDLENKEIELFSPGLKIGVNFLKGRINVIMDDTAEDELSTCSNTEFIGVRNNSETREKIHFIIKRKVNKADLKTRIITQKYPIAHMMLAVTYRIGDTESNFDVTINHDMLASDLNYVERLLYDYQFTKATAILSRYPAGLKIISDGPRLA